MQLCIGSIIDLLVQDHYFLCGPAMSTCLHGPKPNWLMLNYWTE